MRIKNILKVTAAVLLALSIVSALALAASDIGVRLNGEYVDFPDQQPIRLNDRIYVPIRFVAETIGAQVEWEPVTSTVLILHHDNNLLLQIGSRQLFTATGTVDMDVAPIIENDRTMLPIRFVAEALSYSVDWDGGNQDVIIYR